MWHCVFVVIWLQNSTNSTGSTYNDRTNIFTYRLFYGVKLSQLPAEWELREKGVNDPSYKMRTIFLMSLALSVPIFNKKSHRTQAVETFEVWPNFESFHRSCRMRFFVENWHTKSKGHKKKCSHFIRRRVRPLPLPHSWKLGCDR